MNRSLSIWASVAIAVLFAACVQGHAQQAGDADKPAAKPAPTTRSPYRPLAPGVMQTVDPMRALDETVSRHDVVELLAIDPKYPRAKNIAFRHDVWVLDFQFKPMRMISVDLPQPSGRMQRKLVWYMIYSVTNTGKIMHPVADVDLSYDTFDKRQLYEVKMEERPIRFAPEFLLEGHQRLHGDAGFTKVYPDRVIPVAMAAIRTREDPNRRLLNSAEMCREIAVGETLWGAATWEDIDPRIVRFSIYVIGLTNAYKWKDEKVGGRYTHQAGDPIGTGRKLYRKVLKLNFWRPGDQYFEHEEEIRYGIPDGVDYEWVYR
jgi:hypothetical protein